MSYLYDKKRKNKKRWYGVIVVFLGLALFTPVYSWMFSIFEKPLLRSWENKNQFFDGTENFFESFYGKTKLIQKNKELEEEIARLEVDNLRTQYLSRELEKTTGILSQEEMLSARVLSRGVLGSQDSFVVNQGSQHGVVVGDHVYTYNNIAIGLVSQVYATSSQVILFSDVDSVVEGILFPHEVELSMKGQGKGGFIIQSPREIDVTSGDIVYSLEQPGNIIAIVRNVTFDPRDPFKQVYLSYPVNLNEIQTVGIKSQN